MDSAYGASRMPDAVCSRNNVAFAGEQITQTKLLYQLLYDVILLLHAPSSICYRNRAHCCNLYRTAAAAAAAELYWYETYHRSEITILACGATVVQQQ